MRVPEGFVEKVVYRVVLFTGGMHPVLIAVGYEIISSVFTRGQHGGAANLILVLIQDLFAPFLIQLPVNIPWKVDKDSPDALPA